MALPENIVCFQRRSAAELKRRRQGRALHHRFVLVVALRGSVTVCVDDREIRLHDGEGLLVQPFQFHHYIDAESDSLRWLYVTFESSDPASLDPLQFRPFELNRKTCRILRELLESYEIEGQDDLVALHLAVLLSNLRLLSGRRSRSRGLAGTPQLVTRVNTLAQRSQKPLSVQDLADELGISPSHLRERFRTSCGVSLGHHLRRLRLEKACGLLRLTDNRVSEIAEQCGFTSIYSFSRAFRHAYGISPSEYRSER